MSESSNNESRTSVVDDSGDERTNPGVGTGEAYIATTANRDRALAAIRELERTCPAIGAANRRRHIEVLAHACGEAGMLLHDERRLLLRLNREEASETSVR